MTPHLCSRQQSLHSYNLSVRDLTRPALLSSLKQRPGDHTVISKMMSKMISRALLSHGSRQLYFAYQRCIIPHRRSHLETKCTSSQYQFQSFCLLNAGGSHHPIRRRSECSPCQVNFHKGLQRWSNLSSGQNKAPMLEGAESFFPIA